MKLTSRHPNGSKTEKMLCDFHLHTTKSDGVWQPERLFQEIRARGLEAFSITDHDCMEAYPVPEDLRDRCIPGLEVDSHHGGHTVHILAYGIDDPQCELLQVLRNQRESRLERMRRMIDALNATGVAVSMDDVRAHSDGVLSLGRPHLARALVTNGVVASVQEAFDRYLSDDGVAFVALERMTAAQITEMIHRCGGVAVIAHPMRLRQPEHLEELCDIGIDGIEVIHPSATPDDERMLREFAKTRGLFVTGGTDFHAPADGTGLGVELEQSVASNLRQRIESKKALAKN